MTPDLEGLLPDEVRVAIEPIGDWVGCLFEAERESIGRAVASRQKEFATGRVLARRLLAELGRPDVPLLRQEEGRLPIWPEGIVGSISHSGALCMVVVAEESGFRGVGVDLEPDEPVEVGIERIVLRDHEHDWVRAVQGDERGRRCRMVFSAKEAVYKAFYPRTRTFWSFQDVLLSIDLERGAFSAELPASAGCASAEGRILRRSGWIVSAVSVPNERPEEARSKRTDGLR